MLQNGVAISYRIKIIIAIHYNRLLLVQDPSLRNVCDKGLSEASKANVSSTDTLYINDVVFSSTNVADDIIDMVASIHTTTLLLQFNDNVLTPTASQVMYTLYIYMYIFILLL